MEKKSKVQVGEETFYPSEIHLILFIHKEQNESVTQMAQHLGVTKGAVSQTLARLEKKGVLTRTKIPEKKNEMLAELLPFGREVARKCARVSDSLEARISSYLDQASEAEQAAIAGFVEHMEIALKKVVEEMDQ